MDVKNNIIIALDLMNFKDTMNLCEKLKSNIDTVKVGYPLTLAEGLEIVSNIKESFEFNVICDYKVADIPETNSKICDLTFKHGADGIITHGFIGEDSVNACLKSSEEYGKELFLLTEMSHPGAKMFLQKNADDIARMGLEMGIKNYVAPATRLDRLSEIRNILGKNSFIISPGVGKQGGDGKKTLEYADAIIIGRSIYEAKNPQKSLKGFIESIK